MGSQRFMTPAREVWLPIRLTAVAEGLPLCQVTVECIDANSTCCLFCAIPWASTGTDEGAGDQPPGGRRPRHPVSPSAWLRASFDLSPAAPATTDASLTTGGRRWRNYVLTTSWPGQTNIRARG